MEFTEEQTQQMRGILDEANALSISIYETASSYRSASPIKKQLKTLTSLIHKAQLALNSAATRSAVEASSIRLKDLPVSVVEETEIPLKRIEDATANELNKYGIQAYVANYLKPLDILLTCDCDNERLHYHTCTPFDWDRYLNNKRRFRPGRYIPE